MKKYLICVMSAILVMAQTAFAANFNKFVSLTKDELPCNLEEWLDYDRNVYVQMEQTGKRSVYIKQRCIVFEGKETLCDTFVHGGMLYVPVRQVAELLGKTVVYSSETQTVLIKDGNDTTKIMENTQTNKAEKNMQNQMKVISVSQFPIYYKNMILEEKGNALCMRGVFSCDGKLYMPLKTLTDMENMVRTYRDDNIYLIGDFPTGKKMKIIYRTGILKNYVPNINDDVVKQVLTKVASDCTEPGLVTNVTGEKVLYHGKPAVVVNLNVIHRYEYGLIEDPDFLESYIYVLEE